MRKTGALLLIPVVLIMGVALTWNKLGPESPPEIRKESSGLDSLEGYYKVSSEMSVTAQDNIVSFIAVGDIMLSRTVADKIIKNGSDPNFPFRNIKSLLSGSDFNFGNLESPISGSDNYAKPGEVKFNAPTIVLDGLKANNFSILSLANNHMLDQGREGLFNTIDLLDKNGIKTVGAGKNYNEAWATQIINVKGIRVGFLAASYASSNDGGANDNKLVAMTKDLEQMKATIAQLERESDFTVVSMHAGTEYTREPNSEQQKFARSAIDAGADLIIGSHPHWVQTIEQYQGKYIFYSLGNFIFDQEWSRDTKEGLAVKVTLEKLGRQSALQGNTTPAVLKQIELLPVIIEDYSTPRLASDTEAKQILENINAPNKFLY